MIIAFSMWPHSSFYDAFLFTAAPPILPTFCTLTTPPLTTSQLLSFSLPPSYHPSYSLFLTPLSLFFSPSQFPPYVSPSLLPSLPPIPFPPSLSHPFPSLPPSLSFPFNLTGNGYLDGEGFSPIGRVVSGMQYIDAIYTVSTLLFCAVYCKSYDSKHSWKTQFK